MQRSWLVALALLAGVACGGPAPNAQTADAPPALAPAPQASPVPSGDAATAPAGAAPAGAAPAQPGDPATNGAAAQPGAPAAPPSTNSAVANPPAAAVPPVRPAAGLPATVVDLHEAEGILGKSVVSATNEDMGRIVDVIVSGDGHMRAAVIDFGGFLGVGSRKVAVDWTSLQFGSDGRVGQITLALARNQLRLTPEYKPGEPIVIMGMPAPAPVALAAPIGPAAVPPATGAAPAIGAAPPAGSAPSAGSAPAAK